MNDRLFIGVFPAGLTYCDRRRAARGDYLRLAFLPYSTLNLEWAGGKGVFGVPDDLRQRIETHAAGMAARRGQRFQTAASGQTVLLGSKTAARENGGSRKRRSS